MAPEPSSDAIGPRAWRGIAPIDLHCGRLEVIRSGRPTIRTILLPTASGAVVRIAPPG